MEISIVVLCFWLLATVILINCIYDELTGKIAKLQIELDSRVTEEQVKTMINDINVEFTKSWFSANRRMGQLEHKTMCIKADHEKIEVLMGKKL